MRLGGPIFEKWSTPGEWVDAVRRAGYRAAFCPLGLDAAPDQIKVFAAAAAQGDITIAEVGAWSNPLSPDPAVRHAAVEKCKKALALADAIGARCCVNISGSRGAKWDGPHAANLTDETFGMIVDSVRDIIDSVRPTRTSYALETMPWMYPDSAESYAALLTAVDRPACAVHFDPVNLVNSPERYFATAELIRDFVARLGARIKSCHAKDIVLREKLTVHLDEARPGSGGLDYDAYLKAVGGLTADVPLMLEHLPSPEEYAAGAAHIRSVAKRNGVAL